MGCFLACFGGAKDRRRRSRRRSPTTTHSPLPRVTSISIPHRPATPTLLSSDTRPKQSASPAGDVPAQELSVVEKPELEGPSFAGNNKKKVTFDLNITTYRDAVVVEDENSDDEEEAAAMANKSGEGVCNVEAYPLNHRYQNCASSDDEDGIDDDDEEYDDCDFDNDDDDEDGREGNEEEEEDSYESFFSLQLEKERKSCTGEVSSPEPVVVAKGSTRDRSQYVHSVLNPVENLSKWKEVKVLRAAVPTKNSMKENVGSELETKGGTFCFERSFKTRSPSTKPVSTNPISDCSAKQEVSVDTSLSNWLVVTPDNSPMRGTQEKNSSARSNSSVSREDRPILGALTVDDLKQSSVNSSPRRSPSRTPDDIPIVGTVGSYWSSSKGGESSTSLKAPRSVTKGIPNTTSKYGEDKRVNCHSTPFEVRLERALNEGSAAEACLARLPAAAAAAAAAAVF